MGEVCKNEILKDYQEKRIESATDKLLDYYDKTYSGSMLKFKGEGLEISFADDNPAENAEIILNKIKEFKLQNDR